MKVIAAILERSSAARGVRRRLVGLFFPGSRRYWEERYAAHGTSGPGSYGPLAAFKGETVGNIIRRNEIRSVIEFGCGDGNQLAVFDAPRYTGLDVSREGLRLCIQKFRADGSKSFFLYDSRAFSDGLGLLRAELALSLDVVFHLIEDDVFALYMRHLFDSATRNVVVYSSNFEGPGDAPHVRHRNFTAWVEIHATEWVLTRKIPNRHPYDAQQPDRTSFADFYIYERRKSGGEG